MTFVSKEVNDMESCSGPYTEERFFLLEKEKKPGVRSAHKTRLVGESRAALWGKDGWRPINEEGHPIWYVLQQKTIRTIDYFHVLGTPDVRESLKRPLIPFNHYFYILLLLVFKKGLHSFRSFPPLKRYYITRNRCFLESPQSIFPSCTHLTSLREPIMGKTAAPCILWPTIL